MKIKRIRLNETIFVCVDVQTRLTPVMVERDLVISSAKKLLQAADIFDIPVLITQQYTKGLGDTVAEVKEAKKDFYHIEKNAFSIMGEPNFVKALKDSGKNAVVIFGIEAHVCVLQSVLDLLEDGYEVFLVADGISSRNLTDKEFCIKRAALSGAVPTTLEAVFFELLDNDSKSDTFKAISKLIK